MEYKEAEELECREIGNGKVVDSPAVGSADFLQLERNIEEAISVWLKDREHTGFSLDSIETQLLLIINKGSGYKIQFRR